jgi:hypothetical protein
LITAPDSRAALSAEVMIVLPSVMNSSVVTCAEVRIADLTAWGGARQRPRNQARPTWVSVVTQLMACWRRRARLSAPAWAGRHLRPGLS